MLVLNIVSRIANDKDFFLSYLKVVKNLRYESNIDVRLYFIGAITDNGVYHNIVDFSMRNQIDDLISFSKKSIPYSEMNNSENDYYLNISIGEFIGYSTIECLDHSFKTIFINVDKSLNEDYKYKYNCFCHDEKELEDLIINLHSNPEYKKIIEKENKNLLNKFRFTKEDSEVLLNLLYGQN